MALTASDRNHISTSTHVWAAPLALWCLLGVALFAALVFWFDPLRLVTSLGDTDDATRLLEVRALLSGASWYDMTLHRFGGPDPLVSHWSRLVDAPIALLLATFELVLPPATAELAVRALWPLIVLFAFVYLIARQTEKIGGRSGALIAILLTVTCFIGVVQFLPGRIDHHNVIILCTVGGTIFLARSFDEPDAGWGAGILFGLGAAIGYEALALTTASLTLAVLFGLMPGRSLIGPSRAAVTFAATLTMALSLTTAQPELFVSHCDALSFNIVLLTITAALGVTVVQALEHRLHTVAKLALLSVTGAAGLALYAAAEPACLAGPFGEVDPLLFPIWLGGVSETQSMLSLGRQLPLVGGMALVYFAAGAYCGFRLMRTDRDDALRFLMLAFLVAIPLSFWQIKLLPYATFLPIPLIATYLARPPQKANAPMTWGDIGLAAGGALIVIAAAGYILTQWAAPSVSRVKETRKPIAGCQATAAFLPLAHLPKGLVVADVNLGPYLVALTDLDALSAPYHRIGKSIIAAHDIMHASPAQADAELHRIGARYVVTCDGLSSTRAINPMPGDALQTLLFADKPPAFLTPVPLAAPTPLKVWRVNP